MKLGQKVKFSKSLSKQSGYGVNYQMMTEKQKQELASCDGIVLVRYKVREHNIKQGFICGRRNIVTTAELTPCEPEYGDERLQQTKTVWETVYVVACDMRGLYRVREEDLELAEEESA